MFAHLAFGSHIQVEDYRKSSGDFDGSKKQIDREKCGADYLKLADLKFFHGTGATTVGYTESTEVTQIQGDIHIDQNQFFGSLTVGPTEPIEVTQTQRYRNRPKSFLSILDITPPRPPKDSFAR